MKISFFNYNNVLTDIIEHVGYGKVPNMEIAKDITQAQRFVIWNCVIPNTIEFIDVAKRLRVPTITIQHGRHGTARFYPPFNYRIITDKYCAWGERDKKQLIEAGNDPKKIVVTGTTIFNHLEPRVKHEGINIVFSPEHWGIEIPENKEVADELKRLSKKHKWNIITKIISCHNSDWYQNPIYSNRQSREHWPIVAGVLSKADLVVGLLEGTFELLAQSLDIPVITYAKWNPKPCGGDERYMQYRREKSSGSLPIYDIKDLEGAIINQLEHPELLREKRKAVCIDEGGINIKNPLEEIIKVIKQA